MSNITAIQPRRINIGTQANADWRDTFVVWQAGQGGIKAADGNAGNGELVIAAVAPQTATGPYTLTITSITGSGRYTVEHPSGTVSPGTVGLPYNIGGIALQLSSGDTAFAVGDSFDISILPVPIDITGITFTLQARLSAGSANVAFQASSAPLNGNAPLILTGTTGGEVSMVVPKELMADTKLAPNTYVYDMLATAEGRTVVAFVGTLIHAEGVTYLPS